MNAKIELDITIQKIEKEIKQLNAFAQDIKNDDGLTNEELETELKNTKNAVDKKTKELNEAKSLLKLYEETKKKIRRLQFLEELNFKTKDDKNEIERLKKEIETAKEKLGFKLTEALEYETRQLPKLLESSKGKILALPSGKDKKEEEKKEAEQEPEKPTEKTASSPSTTFAAHVSSYESLIDDQIKKLQARINKINKKNIWTVAGNVKASATVKKIQKQIDLLTAEKEKIHRAGFKTDNLLLEITDDKIKNKDDKISEIQKQIEELQQAKAKIKGRLAKKIVEKQIKKRQAKIKQLQNQKVSIVGKQKRYLLPKLTLQMWSTDKLATYTGMTEAYEETVSDMEELKKSASGFFSDFQKSRYESIGKHYQKKYESSKKILEKLNSKNGTIIEKGSTEKIISKEAKEKLSKDLQKQTQSVDTKQAAMAA